MTLAIDASTPALKLVPISGTSVASNTFSPPASSVIVLMVVTIGPSNVVSSVSSVTDSLGSHLTWGLISGARCNTNNVGNLGGTCEVWYASCPSAQTNMTVTPTYTNPAGGGGANEGFILPIVFTGADTTQNGAVATDPQTSAALPSKAVTTTRAGSRVIGCVLNYTNATGATVGTAQTTTINGNVIQVTNSTDADAAWGQMQNANTTSSGTSVTINDTAPSVNHNMVVVEILASSGPTTFTATLSVTGVGVVKLAKQDSKPMPVTGVGVVSLLRTFARPLSVTGVGVVPALVKSVQLVKAVSGVGVVSIAKVGSKTLKVTGVGVPGLAKLDGKILPVTGASVVSLLRQFNRTLGVVGSGVVSGPTKLTTKGLTVTGTGVVGLVKLDAKGLTVVGTGVVSVASLAIIPPRLAFVLIYDEVVYSVAMSDELAFAVALTDKLAFAVGLRDEPVITAALADELVTGSKLMDEHPDVNL